MKDKKKPNMAEDVTKAVNMRIMPEGTIEMTKGRKRVVNVPE